MKKPTKKTNKQATITLTPQLRVWFSKDGRQTRLCDMGDTHVMHSLFLLKRKAMLVHLKFINALNRREPNAVFDAFHPKDEDETALASHNPAFAGFSVPNRLMVVRHTVTDRAQETQADPTPAAAYVKTDIATGMTWRDFVDGHFYPLLLEAYRRDNLGVYIDELLNSDKLRMAK